MKALKSRGLLVFLGLALLALFIWYGGPYLAFADAVPLGSALARLIAIGVLILVWLLSWFLKRLRAGRAGAKLAEAVVAQRAAPSAASREAQQLRERFEEAVAALKKMPGGQRNLYEMPWYVIIGPPGSGKTTALLNSGLKFPLEQRFGKEALRGVGGTRNCDWWFTDEAVLLDTAGRYTTQDSDESADGAGWGEFLALLTRHRKRRPLNGVIVSLSAADLLTQTPAERDANVAAVRRRLDELNRHLKVRLPVYLLLTKCDLIAGFTEYFDDLGADARAAVWGMTFAAERSAAGAAAEDFRPEFAALIERLNQRLFARIEEERDVRRRTASFAFPQQLAGLGGFIGAFVTDVFLATRFDGRLLLRGVYFTSGTQEGTPVDRLMAAIGRGFAVAPGAVATGAAGRGKAYFIEKVLRDVMFAEAGIAGSNRGRELRLAAVQLGIYAGLLLVAVLGVIALSVSYTRNKTYLTEVGAALDALNTVAAPGPRQPLLQLVPGLDALRRVVKVADQFQGHLAWTLHWGLFQGSAVGEEARAAYRHELNDSLAPGIAEGFKARLQSAAAQPDQLYQYLKAYVMLGQPQHLDKEQLAFLVNLDWQQALGERPDAARSLNDHLSSLLKDPAGLRPMPLDDTLVAQTRNTLRQVSLAQLMYDQLRLEHADDVGHELRLDVAAGLGAERVLSRRSGKPLREPVPGMFTRAVFDQIATSGTVGLVKQFSQDSWVMGDGAFDLPGAERATGQVMELYADEYIRAWDAIMNDVQMVAFHTLAQAADVLGILGQPGTSPLKGLLLALDANTNFAKPVEGGNSGAASLAAAAQKAVTGSLSKIFGAGKPAPITPAARITAHFAALNQLVAGAPGGAAPIDGVTAQLAQIGQKMSGVGTGVGEINPLDALTKAGQGEALKALQVQAATLPAPIGALVASVGGSSETLAVGEARGELDQRYRQQVVNQCEQLIAGRYPFSAGSRVDVPLADFGRVFGAGGIYDAFFKDNLAPLVDTTRSPWAWRSGSPAGASPAMLRQFEAAEQIRQRYFGSAAPLPELQFTLTPVELDREANRFSLEVDGQTLDYRHGPVRSLPVKWPGPAPGAAAMTLEDRAGVQANRSFQGPWAWFRLLDAATLKAQTDVRIDAVLQLGGHQATVVIEPASSRNPYQGTGVRQFRCGG